MKTPFLTMVLALLCSVLSLATPVDSILVRIGPSSKVLFYGSKKADLKKLENYDWNTILRDLNARLHETTANAPRQHYMDLTGKSYLNDSTLRSKNSLVKVSQTEQDQALVTPEKMKSNRDFLTQALTFRFGLTYMTANRSHFHLPWNNSMIQSDLLRSYQYGLGLSIYSAFLQKKDWSMGLRWGLEADFKRYLWNQSMYDKISTNITAVQLPLVPTIRFYDSSGKRTYSYGVGMYAGFRLSVKEREIDRTNQYDYTARYDPNNTFQYGLILNAGYRKFGIYAQYELGSKKDYIRQRVSKDNVYYVPTFGQAVRSIAFGITYNGF